MKIGFIGGGNMGEAILSALLDKKLAAAEDITVSDISETRRQYISDKYYVKTSDKNLEVISDKDIIVLAVKPQTLPAVMTEIKGNLQPYQLVVSIIAGATIKTLTEGLGHNSVVRSMPNTPAQIGYGVTAWTATNDVSIEQTEQVSKILGAMGKEFFVDNEDFINMATSISGSGPAYLFYFIEAMIEAALKIGLPPDIAKEMAILTVTGASNLVQQSDKEPAELRRMVTSPGGTTAEAIGTFEKSGFSDLIYQAVQAAYKRAQELGTNK